MNIHNFFNFPTLVKIYGNRDIQLKLSLYPKNSIHFKEYNLITKIDNNFPNNFNKLIEIYPFLIDDFQNEFKDSKIIMIKILLNEKDSKMSLLQSFDYLNLNLNSNI